MPQGDVEPVLGPALGTSCDPVDLLYDQQVERLERSLPLGKLDSIASVRFLDSLLLGSCHRVAVSVALKAWDLEIGTEQYCPVGVQ